MAGAAAAACLHAGAFWRTHCLGFEVQAAAAAALAAACQTLDQASAAGQPAHGQSIVLIAKFRHLTKQESRASAKILLVKVMGMSRLDLGCSSASVQQTLPGVLWLMLLAHKTVSTCRSSKSTCTPLHNKFTVKECTETSYRLPVIEQSCSLPIAADADGAAGLSQLSQG